MLDRQSFEDLATDIASAVRKLDDGDRSSRAVVKAAIIKMGRAMETPAEAILRQRYHTVENLSIIAAEEMGILECLSSDVDERGKTAYELALLCGFDQKIIVRIMRVITAIGFADEVGHQHYKANAITMIQNRPEDQIRNYFRKLKPCKPEDTIPLYEFALNESMWKTLSKNEEWKVGFDNAMKFRQKLFCTAWHTKFPLIEHLATETSRRGDSSFIPTLVDIGGNQGFDLQRVVDALPQLECELVLEDLPDMIKSIPSGAVSERIKKMPYDFFTPQPICGASIYYMKSILHDWDDAASRKVLSNTAKAMDSSSRLLINEVVLAERNEIVDRADLDVMVLFLLNGMERSRSQWAELLSSASPPLEIVDVWSTPEDTQSIIEARLRDAVV